MEVKRIFDLIPRYQRLFGNKEDVLCGKDEGVWVKVNLNEYNEKSNNISYGLMALGVQKGDKIASITFNRPEWNFLDIGIQQIGAIHIPIYPTISDKDYKYILQHAEVKYIFVAGEEMYRRIKHIIPEVQSIKAIYTFKNLHGIEHLNELIELGASNSQPEKLQNIKDSITGDDIVTIIYTSGTMGNPKGVVHAHKNIISNFIAVSYIPPMGVNEKALSFLPLCHIYERMLNYMYQYLGISVYYAESIVTVADNIKEIHPDILGTVPRLLEKIYDKIIATGRKQKGIKKMFFFWALHLGLRYELYNANGWFYNLQLKIARKLVFVKWKEALGTKLDFIVSGGAALQPRLGRVFWAAGFRVLEGYGLTETSPVIAVSTLDPDGVKFGTVGPVLRGVTVKLADDGEILVKSPGVMNEYYKEPELTREAIDSDGWLHTGDIGLIEKEGQLRITGRKKEIFKTSFGKYIAPQPIENKFKESAFIDNIMVLGENQKFAAALIAPDFDHLRNWCKIKGIEYSTDKEMIELPRIKKRFQKEIKKYNEFFGEHEQIRKYHLLENEWSVESGDLTATLKPRRTYINITYKEIIENMFA